MSAARHPWLCTLHRKGEREPAPLGRSATRQAAMNRADKPYQAGFAVVEHARSGERWERRRGVWYPAAARARREVA